MTTPAEAPYEDGSEGHSVLDVLDLLRRHARVLIALPLVACISAILVSLILPERYTVESRFMPESSSAQVSRLAGLAAQFGFDIPGSETGASVDFYAELLESHDLLRAAVLTDYTFRRRGDTVSANLVELLDVKGDTPGERTRNAVEALGDLVTVRPDPMAEIVSVRTSARWPELAVLVNRRLLELLNTFNLERRQSRAASERSFLEARVLDAERDLVSAEAALERFLSQNRRYAESPQLTFEYARLQRRVDLRQQVYTSLSQAYEQARVDEVRNTPVITIIDEPRGPAKQTSPRIALNALLGVVLGVLLALTIVLSRELMESARRRDPRRYDALAGSSRWRRFLGAGAARRSPEPGGGLVERDPPRGRFPAE